MLAIVVPYYKKTFFEATLESLRNQTDKRFSVYIGNDSSPEDPSELLLKYKNDFEFEYFHFNENLGGKSLTKQWERCLEMIKNEEWIMILGDDDVLEDNVVASWWANYENFQDCNVVRFSSKVLFEVKKTVSYAYTHPVREKASQFFYRRFKGQTRSSLSEYVFRKDAYKKYGFSNYPLAWHSDDRAWIEFSGDKNIYAINESCVEIRISDVNITGKDDNLIPKRIATEEFFGNFLLKNLQLFEMHQRLDFLMVYEVTLKSYRRLKLRDWFMLFVLYLKNFRIVPFLKFVRRFILNSFQ